MLTIDSMLRVAKMEETYKDSPRYHQLPAHDVDHCSCISCARFRIERFQKDMENQQKVDPELLSLEITI